MAIVAPVVNQDVIKKMFMPVVMTLASDPIANIRMNVAKTIQAIYPVSKGTPEIEVTL